MEEDTSAGIRLDNISAAFEQSVGPGLYSVDPVFVTAYGKMSQNLCRVGLSQCKIVGGGDVTVESSLRGIDRKLSRYPSLPSRVSAVEAAIPSPTATFPQQLHKFRGRLANREQFFRPESQIIPCSPSSADAQAFEPEETRNAVKDRWASAKKLSR